MIPALRGNIATGRKAMSILSRRDGRAYLKPVQTVTAGVPFGRPYHSPFAVR